MTNEVIFTAQVFTFIFFVGALFYLYRVLVSQKDATIQLLKEKNEFLIDKLNDAKEAMPDVLAKTLSDRVKMLETEIDRLSTDKETNRLLIAEKEKDLVELKKKTIKLAEHFKLASELLEEFSCPECGAPMDQKEYHSECVEDNCGRDVDIEHEYISYECGYSLSDGNVANKCRGDK